jgi:hypothetical protein
MLDPLAVMSDGHLEMIALCLLRAAGYGCSLASACAASRARLRFTAPLT